MQTPKKENENLVLHILTFNIRTVCIEAKLILLKLGIIWHKLDFFVPHVRQIKRIRLLIFWIWKSSWWRIRGSRKWWRVLHFCIGSPHFQRLSTARTPLVVVSLNWHEPIILQTQLNRLAILNKALQILVQNPHKGLVGVTIRFPLGCKRKKAPLTHLPYVRELLVVVTKRQRGHVLLVSLTNRLIVIEIRISVNHNMIKPGAQPARDMQFKESCILIGRKCKKPIKEEYEYQHPFKQHIDHKMCELPHFLLNKIRKWSSSHVGSFLSFLFICFYFVFSCPCQQPNSMQINATKQKSFCNL